MDNIYPSATRDLDVLTPGTEKDESADTQAIKTARPCMECGASFTYLRDGVWHCKTCGWSSDMKRRYTDEELELLIQMHHDKNTHEAMAKKLNRSKNAIGVKLVELKKASRLKDKRFMHDGEPLQRRINRARYNLKKTEVEPKPEKQIKGEKLEFHRIPPHQLESVAEVMNTGGDKHGDHSYMEYKPIHYWNACMRHLMAIRKGEKIDPEDGKSHAAHLACAAMILDRIMSSTELQFGDEKILKMEAAE